MSESKAAGAAKAKGSNARARTELPTLLGLVATVIAMVFQQQLFGDLSDTPLDLVKFVALFGVMLVCAFGVVRHSDAVAELLG